MVAAAEIAVVTAAIEAAIATEFCLTRRVVARTQPPHDGIGGPRRCHFLFPDPTREVTVIRRVLATVLIAPIRFYQIAISPMIGPSCRFTPTCSQYAIESIRKHGAVVGLYRAMRRIARCHPFHPGGYDPP